MSANNNLAGLPKKGTPESVLGEELKRLQVNDVSWREGRSWSLVFQANEEHDNVIKNAYLDFFSTNYLNPFAFPSLQKMELDVVRMTAHLLHGEEGVCGTMTSGGTESILLAVYSCRELARKKHPRIRHPEIVAPQSVHPAFDKAAHLFGLRLRKAPLDSNQRAHPAAMERLIGKNTVMLVASAPCYPSGTLDPIPEIGALAVKYKLLFHVDACMGGFMLPWVEKLGNELPAWDFRVSGVSSMSADVHKFGYGAKGASVVLYRSMEQLRRQFFIATDFPGGIYASPTLLGTRPGGAISAAWAGMMHLGEEGYLKLAQQILDSTLGLREALLQIPEIRLVGVPCMNILAFKTANNQPDIFAVADQMEKKGWLVDRQQDPGSIHLTIFPTNIPVTGTYVKDLKESIEFAKAHPESVQEGNAALYGLMARIPFRGMVKQNVRKVLEGIYGETYKEEETIANPVPSKWMGWVNRILAFLRK